MKKNQCKMNISYTCKNVIERDCKYFMKRDELSRVPICGKRQNGFCRCPEAQSEAMSDFPLFAKKVNKIAEGQSEIKKLRSEMVGIQAKLNEQIMAELSDSEDLRFEQIRKVIGKKTISMAPIDTPCTKCKHCITRSGILACFDGHKIKRVCALTKDGLGEYRLIKDVRNPTEECSHFFERPVAEVSVHRNQKNEG